MPCSLSWYHDMLANTLLVDANEALCVTGTLTKHLLDCVGFVSKCSFTKLTCCEFTVGPLLSINYNPVKRRSICEERGLLLSLCVPRQYTAAAGTVRLREVWAGYAPLHWQAKAALC